jgi:negative regulator of flagellin synthesis FlgM
MGISKIGKLFASNADAIQQQRSQEMRDAAKQAKSRPSTTAADRSSTGDAVVISQSMRAATQQNAAAATDPSRAERVQRLKEQIKSGSYQPDSEKVAVAVMKELA